MFCIRCGKENVDGAQFCYSCGWDLSRSAPPGSDPGTESLQSRVASGLSVGEAGATRLEPEERSDASLGLNPGALVDGRYRIDRLLGRGGMGSVWLANDQNLNRSIALKFIASGFVQSAAIRQRFLREAQVCLDLTHPNIVRVHYLGEWKSHLYLAMEFLNGTTLQFLLDRVTQQKRPLDWPRIYTILRQAQDGIAFAHSKGVIHRDVKPSNIMLAREKDGSYRVVVMDFGLAKLTQGVGQTRLGAALGSAIYVAPEQLSGAASVDHRADVYSLGVLAYQLITGRLPMGGRPAPPSRLRAELPQGVDEWVFRAIEQDPADRFATVQEMAQALQAVGPKVREAGEEHRVQTLRGLVEVAMADGKLTDDERAFLMSKAQSMSIPEDRAKEIIFTEMAKSAQSAASSPSSASRSVAMGAPSVASSVSGANGGVQVPCSPVPSLGLQPASPGLQQQPVTGTAPLINASSLDYVAAVTKEYMGDLSSASPTYEGIACSAGQGWCNLSLQWKPKAQVDETCRRNLTIVIGAFDYFLQNLEMPLPFGATWPDDLRMMTDKVRGMFERKPASLKQAFELGYSSNMGVQVLRALQNDFSAAPQLRLQLWTAAMGELNKAMKAAQSLSLPSDVQEDLAAYRQMPVPVYNPGEAASWTHKILVLNAKINRAFYLSGKPLPVQKPYVERTAPWMEKVFAKEKKKWWGG